MKKEDIPTIRDVVDGYEKHSNFSEKIPSLELEISSISDRRSQDKGSNSMVLEIMISPEGDVHFDTARYFGFSIYSHDAETLYDWLGAALGKAPNK